MNENYEAVSGILNNDKESLALLVRNSFTSAFITQDEKDKLVVEVDNYMMTNA